MIRARAALFMTIRQSVLSTLAYHSMFKYPLTEKEVHRLLISDTAVSREEVRKIITSLVRSQRILEKGPYVVCSFAPRSWFVVLKSRKSRENFSQKKLILARRAAHMMGLIPWVKMVAITGALSMNNADENDDIDLMIVTEKDRLWLTRPLVTALVSLFFKRRRRNMSHPAHSTHVTDSLCLNLWLDKSALPVPMSQRNLYTAHELAQMKPIVNKKCTYEQIMWKNRWGRKFLANRWKEVRSQGLMSKGQEEREDSMVLSWWNRVGYVLQFWYMKSKMTNERASLHAAFFHPIRRADTILSIYDRLCHRCF